MSKAKEHFDSEKKPHTEIKHKIFYKTLESSLSIANIIPNRSVYQKKKYTYIDLYAGAGSFEDESKGSPLIAFDIIEKHLTNEDSSFDEVWLVATEENTDNAKKLEQSLKEKAGSINNEKVKIAVGKGKWETFDEPLKNILNNSQWGFIFADPFSVELRIGKLKEIFQGNIVFKDILLLVNNNNLKRVFGAQNLQIIADYFDCDLDFVNDLNLWVKTERITIEEAMQILIETTFKDLNKDFVINVAIPTTQKDKLENSDRFYLTLITGSNAVADNFLTCYAELLGEKQKQSDTGQLSLFSQLTEYKYFTLNQKITDIVGQSNKILLLTLFKKLYNDFYSWKKAHTDEIPTSSNILKVINSLSEEGKLYIECPEDFLNKTKQKAGKTCLKSEAFKHKENLTKISLVKG